MRALITGADGFVGRYLTEALRRQGSEPILAGGPDAKGPFIALDITDADSVRSVFTETKPEVIFHLAAQTFVPDSIASPRATYETNVLGTAAMLQAMREQRDAGGPAARLMLISSAEVYGKQDDSAYPLSESVVTSPANPYAASKAAAESVALGEARTYVLDVVITRAFNHIGPGQSDRFAVAAFASQLAAIAKGAPPLLLVGNLEAKRDFLDVRDVVEAYVALARDGEAGEIYNVASGSAVSMREVLGELVRIARVPVEIREDPARMRPSDTPLSCGNSEKLRTRTGWAPKLTLRRSLQDVYAAALSSAP